MTHPQSLVVVLKNVGHFFGRGSTQLVSKFAGGPFYFQLIARLLDGVGGVEGGGGEEKLGGTEIIHVIRSNITASTLSEDQQSY